MQQQQQQIHNQEKLATQQKQTDAPINPWQKVSQNKNVVERPETFQPPAKDLGSVLSTSVQKPSLTLRQTIARTPSQNKNKSKVIAASSQNYSQSDSTENIQIPPASTVRNVPGSSSPSSTNTSALTSTPAFSQPSIQSIRHIPRPEPYQTTIQHASPSPNSLSLASILKQQQAEKDVIREAANAKRSLQDIQLEQEFQEWWDKESKRVMELAEAEAEAVNSPGSKGKRGARRRRPGDSGRGGSSSGDRGWPSQCKLGNQGSNENTDLFPASASPSTLVSGNPKSVDSISSKHKTPLSVRMENGLHSSPATETGSAETASATTISRRGGRTGPRGRHGAQGKV